MALQKIFSDDNMCRIIAMLREENKQHMDVIDGVMTTYMSISDLNAKKGINIVLTNGIDNTQTIIDALNPMEEFIGRFDGGNIDENKFGISMVMGGYGISKLIIQKIEDTKAYIIAYLLNGKILTRYYNGTLYDWTGLPSDGLTDDGTITITGQNEEVKRQNGFLPEDLGFTRDVMTWANGLYKISHGVDLTNTPDGLQSGRLEHFNLKRWNGNHNPSIATHSERMSIFYSVNGNIYTRVTTSGATAGVITSDTGWRKIPMTNKNGDIELDKNKKVTTNLGTGTWQVGQRIYQDTAFTSSTKQASFELVAKNDSTGDGRKYQVVQIYQITPIEGGTNASMSFRVYEDGDAQLTLYPHTKNMTRNDYNIVCEGYLKEYVAEVMDIMIDGNEIKCVTINLSDDDFQMSGTAGTSFMKTLSIGNTKNVVKVEGYYIPPSDSNKKKCIVTANSSTDGNVGNVYFNGSNWAIKLYCSTNTSTYKGSGYVKIYYVD